MSDKWKLYFSDDELPILDQSDIQLDGVWFYIRSDDKYPSVWSDIGSDYLIFII